MSLLLATLALAFSPACAPEGEVQPVDGPESLFLRYTEKDEATGEASLQTAIVRYKDDEGRAVDLIGVVHIGEQSYYEEMNAIFKSYEALLYELVAPETYRPEKAEHTSGLGLFQKGFGDMLGLTFQLDWIDYQAENFVHADVTPGRLSDLMDENGDNLYTVMLSAMLASMKANANIDPEEAQAAGIEMMLALLSTDNGRSLKNVLAKQFGDLEKLAAGLNDSRAGELLLTERNKACVEVIEKQLDAGQKRIGVFYGAAHMPDLEKRLRGMGFEATSEVWLDAWAVPARKKKKKQAQEF